MKTIFFLLASVAITAAISHETDSHGHGHEGQTTLSIANTTTSHFDDNPSETHSHTASGLCEANEDHSSCRSGVTVPVTAPTTLSAIASTHTEDNSSQSSGASAATSGATSAKATTSNTALAQSTNAAAVGLKNGGIAVVIFGAVGAFVV